MPQFPHVAKKYLFIATIRSQYVLFYFHPHEVIFFLQNTKREEKVAQKGVNMIFLCRYFC
jgi:hypothetical protein